jgi:hypothetical protein
MGVALAIFLFAVPNQPLPGPSSKPEDGPRVLLDVGLVMALSLSCGPLLQGDYVFVILPGLFGSVMLACMRTGYPAEILWLSVIAWCVGLLSTVLPVTIKFLEPYVWSLPLRGITILGTARVCVSLFIATILAAAVLWSDRKSEKVIY